MDDAEASVYQQIEELRKELRHQLHEPRRWFGSLRRLSLARAIRGSNSIEGFDAALDDAAAVVLGEEPLDTDHETTLALSGYRLAMTYVLGLSDETDFEYSTRLVKSLHFMMTSYALDNRPGLWRQGDIYVRDEETDKVVYEGAHSDSVPVLVEELVEDLNGSDGGYPIIRAGMAHLNFVMIHPFRDGNGRMARCLQSLVLAREGVPLSPIFVSIEEYLGRNTMAYYDVLAEVGGGSWQPAGDARPWLRFTLTAHLHQAKTMVRRIEESAELWSRLETIAHEKKLLDRTLVAMFDAAVGLRVRRSTYMAGVEETAEPIPETSATRDLRKLAELGLLKAKGEKRGRYYTAGEELVHARTAVIQDRGDDMFANPFAR